MLRHGVLVVLVVQGRTCVVVPEIDRDERQCRAATAVLHGGRDQKRDAGVAQGREGFTCMQQHGKQAGLSVRARPTIRSSHVHKQ